MRALFGGSFDPPHLGHVLVCCWVRAVYGVDTILVCPVWHHPYGKPLRPWHLRWQLCAAAFAGQAGTVLSNAERDNPTGTTWDLLEVLAARHGTAPGGLIGGSDTHTDLVNWYRGTELAERVAVLSVPRRGFDDHHPAALPAISSTLVRERLAAGDAVDDLVPAAVARRLAATDAYDRPS